MSRLSLKTSELHRPLNGEAVVMRPESAQLTKYSANAYLANRIVFINQISDLAEKTGADVQEIIRGIGLDRRIGLHYWWPGLQYGGSCFLKMLRSWQLMPDGWARGMDYLKR